MALRESRVALVLLALTVTLSCDPTNWTRQDDFRKGCYSERECAVLTSEALDRLSDCRRYLVGNPVKYRSHLERCTYEADDYGSAVEKARRWWRQAHAIPTVPGGAFGTALELGDGGPGPLSGVEARDGAAAPRSR